MLEDLLKGPEWKSRTVTYEKGRIIFSEGDEGGDLYILVSGEIEIVKGDKKIASISQEGSIFGEMASLLSNKRTATVRAATRVEAVRIPLEEVGPFLLAHPQTSAMMARNLAARLDETSRIIYGLKEICDQLPDAVVVTDAECRIMVWNKAAEEILGRGWDEIKNKRLYEIFLEPEQAKKIYVQVGEGSSSRDITLEMTHPQKGKRLISSAVKPLFDSSGAFLGLLSSSRDVTGLMEGSSPARGQRKRAAALLFFLLLAGAAGVFAYVFFGQKNTVPSSQALELQQRLARDYSFLASLLKSAIKRTDGEQAGAILRSFLTAQGKENCPYRAVLLLDGERKVVAYAGRPGEDTLHVETYAGVQFDNRTSAHSVVTLYRVTADKPMGEKTLEAAFILKDQGRGVGWVVFDLDTELLEKRFGVTAEVLQAMRFEVVEG